MEQQIAKKEHFNELPMITFRWLKANDLRLTSVKADSFYDDRNAVISGAELVSTFKGEIKDFLHDYQGTNKEELDLILNAATSKRYIESSSNEALVHLSYDLDENHQNLATINIFKVKAGETLNVLMDLKGGQDTVLATMLNLIEVEKGGVLNLHKINRLNLNCRHIEQRHSQVAETGQVHATSIELGAKESIIHYLTDLAGDEAHGELQSFYVGNGNRIIDLFHQMNHFGQRCTSNMEIRGALTDQAKKYFRGTLDFRTGSSGSEGGEVETVMLLDPKVKSFAIPLLLCGEDDVIGNHAASAGQIDDDKLFYLMSRGFSKEEAQRMVVESSFRPIIDALPLEPLKDEILERLYELMKKVN